MIDDEIIKSLAMGDEKALSNGKKLVSNFTDLKKSADSLVYWAKCSGSGKNPYEVSVVFGSGNPSLKCSCPSAKHNPVCKHELGLLFTINEKEKKFCVEEMPEALAQKLSRKENNARKKEEIKKAALEGTVKKEKSASITAAKRKKIEKQLESLGTAKKILDEILANGLSSIDYKKADEYRESIKELSSYIPGLQLSFLKIIRFPSQIYFKEEHKPLFMQKALQEAVKVNSLIKKASAFLSEILESGKDDGLLYNEDENYIFEALGGVWKLENLLETGSFEKNARIIQLSFEYLFDDVKYNDVDRGFYINIDSGEIFQNIKVRPTKKILPDDSEFDLLEVPLLCKYPGFGCKRIRWDEANAVKAENADFEKIISYAKPLAAAVKETKNIAKNTLSPSWYPALIKSSKLLACKGSYVLCDTEGSKIILENFDTVHEVPNSYRKDVIYREQESVQMLKALPRKVDEGAFFGVVFYDDSDSTYKFHPCSFVAKDGIVRLLF